MTLPVSIKNLTPKHLQLEWFAARHYTDVFPPSFFETECVDKLAKHTIYFKEINTEGHFEFDEVGLISVSCLATIIDCVALINYVEVSQDQIEVHQGVLTVLFNDNTRTAVDHVHWTLLDHDTVKDCAISNWHTSYGVEEAVRGLAEVKTLSRNKFIVEERKRKDNHTCQACNYRLILNEKSITDCHHVNPLGDTTKATLTSIDDLITLCPNCHRIAHSATPPLPVEEIKAINKIQMEDAKTRRVTYDINPLLVE